MRDKLKAGLALTIVLATTGCVSGGQPGRPPATPYKGDAIWNISRTSTPPDAPLALRDVPAHRSTVPADVR